MKNIKYTMSLTLSIIGIVNAASGTYIWTYIFCEIRQIIHNVILNNKNIITNNIDSSSIVKDSVKEKIINRIKNGRYKK